MGKKSLLYFLGGNERFCCGLVGLSAHPPLPKDPLFLEFLAILAVIIQL